MTWYHCLLCCGECDRKRFTLSTHLDLIRIMGSLFLSNALIYSLLVLCPSSALLVVLWGLGIVFILLYWAAVSGFDAAYKYNEEQKRLIDEEEQVVLDCEAGLQKHSIVLNVAIQNKIEEKNGSVVSVGTKKASCLLPWRMSKDQT